MTQMAEGASVLMQFRGSVAPRRNNEGRGAVDWEATFHSPPSYAPDCLISCEDCECPSRSDGPPGYSCPNVARKISGTVPAVPLTPMVGKGASLPLRPVLRVFQPPLYGCFRCWEFRSLGGYVVSRRSLSGPATQDAPSRCVTPATFHENIPTKSSEFGVISNVTALGSSPP